MSTDSALPQACERCTSLLLRGTTACRVCGWDSAAAAAPIVTPATAPVGYGTPAGPGAQLPPGPSAFGATAVPVRTTHDGTPPQRRPAPVGLGRAVMSLVRIVILLDLVMTFMTWLLQRQVDATLGAAVSDDLEGYARSSAKATGLLLFTGLGWVVYAFVFLAAGIVTIVWTFQAHRNAVARGTHPQRLGEGWTIAGWLVPGATLIVPFIVVGDIWRANDPNLRRNRGACPTSLVVWWSAWLLSTVISLVTWLHRDANGIHLNALTYLGLLSLCVSGAAFVHMLRTLTAWQQVAPVAPAPVGAPV